MTIRFTTSAIIYAVLIGAFFVPLNARAAAPHTVELSPAVIDEKAKQRDIIKESVTIQNNSSRPLKLFPAVEDVNPANGDQSFSYAGNADDRSDSLANWIELSRGVIELQPGEQKTVPFIIHVNMNAVPGTYHAAITFTDGGTRDETASKNPDGTLAVNLEIQADVKEDLQLMRFSTDRIAFTGDDILFNYQLENIGNQDLQPTGDIRIYDRRGQEVATLDINKDGRKVSPQQMQQLASVWSAVNGFGQFKALITVRFGASQTAAVQDTIFFWVVPWKQILGLFTATLIVMIILAVYFRNWFEERHLNKLAMAGLLKTHPITAAALASVPHFPAVPLPVKTPTKPMAAKEPTPPKERLVVTIAENIVIAWRLFTTYKRSGRLTPEDIAQKKIVTQMQTEAAVTPHSHMDQPVTYEAPVQRREHADGTIDLKRIQKPQIREGTTESHVVNLKRPL